MRRTQKTRRYKVFAVSGHFDECVYLERWAATAIVYRFDTGIPALINTSNYDSLHDSDPIIYPRPFTPNDRVTSTRTVNKCAYYCEKKKCIHFSANA